MMPEKSGERKKGPVRVLIVTRSFFIGGFTKSLLHLLWCLKKYPEVKVDLLVLERNDSPLLKDVPKGIDVRFLDDAAPSDVQISFAARALRYLGAIFTRFGGRFYHLRYLLLRATEKDPKRADRKRVCLWQGREWSLAQKKRKQRVAADGYDCVVSWEEVTTNYFVAARVSAPRKVGYVHPNYIGAGFCKKYDEKCFLKLDAVAAVAESCREALVEVFPAISEKFYAVPNRISPDYLHTLAKEAVLPLEREGLTLMTVARLENRSKALFRLVSVAKKLKEKGHVFRWYIVGDGVDKDAFCQSIADAELEDIIICLGAKDNPYPYLKQADLFVLQSFYEGRPVTVDEAMVLGVPAFVTNYSSAKEQVAPDAGFVVENDEDAIVDGLSAILENPKFLAPLRAALAAHSWEESESCSAFFRLLRIEEGADG